MDKEPITIQGLENLKEELIILKEKKRPEIVAAIAEARSHGDLKENAEYHAAREEQSLIVYKKQLMQSHAPFRFIEDGDIDTEDVGFGNKVTVLEEGKDEPEIYNLLGPIEFELDSFPNIVTYHSPFAQEMIGKEIGDHFILEIEGKDVKFTVQAIEKVGKVKSQS